MNTYQNDDAKIFTDKLSNKMITDDPITTISRVAERLQWLLDSNTLEYKAMAVMLRDKDKYDIIGMLRSDLDKVGITGSALNQCIEVIWRVIDDKNAPDKICYEINPNATPIIRGLGVDDGLYHVSEGGFVFALSIMVTGTFNSKKMFNYRLDMITRNLKRHLITNDCQWLQNVCFALMASVQLLKGEPVAVPPEAPERPWYSSPAIDPRIVESQFANCKFAAYTIWCQRALHEDKLGMLLDCFKNGSDSARPNHYLVPDELIDSFSANVTNIVEDHPDDGMYANRTAIGFIGIDQDAMSVTRYQDGSYVDAPYLMRITRKEGTIYIETLSRDD